MRWSLGVALALLLGCTDESGARRLLEAQSYTDIEIGGYAWFDCAEDDDYQTAFSATSPAGTRVSGAVCCGVFGKNCTIRLESP